MGMGSAIATSAAGTNQTILGLYQLNRAKKLKKDSYIPPSLQQNIAEAETLAGKTRYTGQSYDEARTKEASANALGAAKEATNSSANLLNAASVIQRNEDKSINAIGEKALKFQEVNRNNASNLRGMRANIEMENMKRFWAAKSALKGAGIQNFMQGQASIHQGAGSFIDSMPIMGGGMGGGMMGGGGNLASNSQFGSQINNQQMMVPQLPGVYS